MLIKLVRTLNINKSNDLSTLKNPRSCNNRRYLCSNGSIVEDLYNCEQRFLFKEIISLRLISRLSKTLLTVKKIYIVMIVSLKNWILNQVNKSIKFVIS